jgi:D-alanine-D-alanine ligase
MRTINKEQILAKAGHVVVLKGGTSPEREISLLSGGAVAESLLRLGVQTTVIDVGKDIAKELQAAAPDLVVNMLHGQGGEDGVIQGMMDLLGISYTGSGVLASALAMDKVKSKLIWRQIGLATADFVELHDESDWDDIIHRFGKAVVKPIYGGSSLGIAIVETATQLQQKYKSAMNFEQGVMAEKYVDGPEYSAGILGDELLPTILLETDRQFFDYEAKYIDENTRIICPVEFTEKESSYIEALVRKAYQSLGCSGLARVDFMQDSAGDYYLLELNTVPGMTSHSFVPTSAARIGIDFDELMLRILDFELSA